MEDYKKKYEETLERARTLHKLACETSHKNTRMAIEELFPELKDTEDERIRKEIIYYLDRQITLSDFGGDIASFKEWIAWLEKQGEHANFRNQIQIGDEVTRNEDGALVNISQFKRMAKQGEQNPTDKVEPKFKVGDTIVEKDLDEYNYETIKDIKNGQYIFTDGYSMNISEQEGWQIVKISANIEQIVLK